jgi:hypothetical protein
LHCSLFNLIVLCFAQVGLTDVTQYEHRVGRTGRAGKTGEALLLLANDESRLLPLLAGVLSIKFKHVFQWFCMKVIEPCGPATACCWSSSSQPRDLYVSVCVCGMAFPVWVALAGQA